jgi:hypothetical protein
MVGAAAASSVGDGVRGRQYVKVDHRHGAKVCYRMTTTVKDPGIYLVGIRTVIVGYVPYTGHWYAWDDDGNELATFTRDFYDKYLRSARVADLVADPDCVPAVA